MLLMAQKRDLIKKYNLLIFMPEKKETKKISGFKKQQVADAQRTLLEQLFDDHYRFRWKIYQVNFFRGIFFGLGSVLGASVVVGLLLWVLSFFTDLPVVGDFFEQSQSTIKNRNQ